MIMSKKVHRDGWVNLQRTRRRFKFPWITEADRQNRWLFESMLVDAEEDRFWKSGVIEGQTHV